MAPLLNRLEESERAGKPFGQLLAEASGDGTASLEKLSGWLNADESVRTAQAAAREQKLQPFEGQIATLIAAWDARNPASNYASGIGKSIKRQALRIALQEHVLAHGAMPTRQLTAKNVPHLGGRDVTFDLDGLLGAP